MRKANLFLLALGLIFISSYLVSEETEALLSGAYEKYLAGNLTESVNLYQKILSANPQSLPAHLNMATVLDILGRKEEALTHWRAAFNLAPTDKTLLAKLGWANFFNQDYLLAEDFFQKAIALDELNGQAHLGLGRSFSAQQEWLKAEKEYYRAAELNPYSALPFFYLGRIYESANLKKEALALYQLTRKCDYYFWEANDRIKKINQAASSNKPGKTDPGPKLDPEYFTRITSLPVWGKNKPALPLNEENSSAIVTSERKDIILKIGLSTNRHGKRILRKRAVFFVREKFIVRGARSGKVYLNETSGKARTAANYWVIGFSPEDRKIKLIGPGGVAKLTSPGPIIIEPQGKQKSFAVVIGDEWREYQGRLEIVVYGDGFNIINLVNLEEYLYGVISAEMIPTWPMAALKAQAVISRTLAIYMKKVGEAHSREGYDLCAYQHCQVYVGKQGELRRTKAAVDSTQGEYLLYQGRLASLFYSSNCGGVVRDSKEMDGWGRHPYLKTLPDAQDEKILPRSPWEWDIWIRDNPKVYCQTSADVFPAEFRWVRIVGSKDFAPYLREKLGRINQVIPLCRDHSGHVCSLKIIGSKGAYVLSGDYKIRQMLRGETLRSTLFVIDTERNAEQKVINFIFWGGGWGHGVGFCQSGAAGLASQGNNYRQILKHYFSDLKIIGEK